MIKSGGCLPFKNKLNAKFIGQTAKNQSLSFFLESMRGLNQLPILAEVQIK